MEETIVCADAAIGPKEPRSTVLTPEQEAACVAFCNAYAASNDTTLAAPQVGEDKRGAKTFKKYSIGYFHINIAEVSTEVGKLYLFVAIDRTPKFAYAELLEQYGKMEAAQFLRNLVAVVPYKIHTVLADNGIQFTNRKSNKYAFAHIFDRVCHKNHRQLREHLYNFLNAYNFAKRLNTLQGLTPYKFIVKC